MSAVASAQANHSPMLVLGGRAPALRWGQGSLQEIDHVPFVRPLAKLAATAGSAEEIPGLVDDAFAAARAPHGGVAFVDFPLDYVFMEAEEPEGNEHEAYPGATSKAPAAEALQAAADLLSGAERPVIMAGTDLYWGRGEGELPELEDSRAPLHPMRVYAELAAVLDRDAIVVGDGGDFVSYAGRVVDSYLPGCWLDPGPFGCLGTGPGYALAAKLAHPDRQA